MKKEDRPMLQSIKDLFTKHLLLKFLSLILALLAWFYIVIELNKGPNEELELLRKMRASKINYDETRR